MWPFSRRLNQSPIPAYIAFALSVLLGATLLVPTPGFSTTPAVGVGDVTTAMWYETNVDAISAADSEDTDRIIGYALTAITKRDDAIFTVPSAWPINFFGTKYEGICVTTNGTVSPVATASSQCTDRYDRGLATLATDAQAPLIAAFSNDVDGSEDILPEIGTSIATVRLAAENSGSRTLTVTTRASHGLSSPTNNLCVMFVDPRVSNVTTSTIWRTDEFWYCGTAKNASGTTFEMTVPLDYNLGGTKDVTNMTTDLLTPSFSRIYISTATELNRNVDNTSYSVARGFDGFGHLSSIYFGTATIRGQEAMVVTWYRHAQNDGRNADVFWNTFQIVILKKATTNGSSVGFDYDFEFNYGTIQDGDDGYSALDPTSSCSSMTTNCRTGVGVVDFNAGVTDVYELFPSTPSRDLVDWGGTTSLTGNSLNATVNGVTTQGRYSFAFNGGSPVGFATPIMDGSGQVVGGNASSATNPSQVYMGPITLSLTPAKVPASGDVSVAINGRRLADVTEVYVGTLKAEIVSRKGTELIFKRPSLTSGRYVIRVVSTLGEFTFDGLVIGAGQSAASQPATSNTVSGFGTGSSRLTSAMRAAIRQAVAAAPRSARVTCQGSTSGPISLPRDRVLADRRSEVACAFIARIRPDLAPEALRGKPDNRRSAELRNVQIRIFG